MSARTTTNLAFVAFLGLSVLITPFAQAAVERQSLNGHVPAVAARSQPIGRLPGSSQLKLAISLPLRNQEALTNLLEQVHDPASPELPPLPVTRGFCEGAGPGGDAMRPNRTLDSIYLRLHPWDLALVNGERTGSRI